MPCISLKPINGRRGGKMDGRYGWAGLLVYEPLNIEDRKVEVKGQECHTFNRYPLYSSGTSIE